MATVESYVLQNLPALMGIAAMWGSTMWRIKSLEKKMDKHNCLIERMAIAEKCIEEDERRIRELETVLPRRSRKKEEAV